MQFVQQFQTLSKTITIGTIISLIKSQNNNNKHIKKPDSKKNWISLHFILYPHVSNIIIIYLLLL